MSRPDAPAPIAVVSALREELRPLLARMSARQVRFADGIRLWQGRLGGRSLIVARAGDGSRRAERGANILLEAARPEILLGSGVAGALTPGLAVGDLVVGDHLGDRRGPAPAPPAAWLDRACAAGGARPADLWSAEKVVCSAQEKRELAGRFPAGRLAAVDLESAAWARAAARRGTPCLVCRAITDGADEVLPGFLADCQEPGGSMRLARVAAHALIHPSAAGSLLLLRRRVASAAERLAQFLEDLVQ